MLTFFSNPRIIVNWISMCSSWEYGCVYDYYSIYCPVV